MTKRKRDNSEVVGDKVSDDETINTLPLEDKRPRVPETVDELEVEHK